MKEFFIDCRTVEPEIVNSLPLAERDKIHFLCEKGQKMEMNILGFPNIKLTCYELTNIISETDFYMAVGSYIGCVIGSQRQENSQYIIVTKNECLLCLPFLSLPGDVSAINPQKEINNKNNSPKITGENSISKEEIEKYIKEKYNAEEILKIVNNYKTRKACCKHLICFFGRKQGENIYTKLFPLLITKGRT